MTILLQPVTATYPVLFPHLAIPVGSVLANQMWMELNVQLALQGIIGFLTVKVGF